MRWARGNWTIAAYIDERADDQQTAALGAIFSGTEGGPMAAFAPLVGKHLGMKKAAIKYAITGKSRSAEIPGVMRMAVAPLPTMHQSGEIWGATGHPVAPDKLAFAVGSKDSNTWRTMSTPPMKVQILNSGLHGYDLDRSIATSRVVSTVGSSSGEKETRLRVCLRSFRPISMRCDETAQRYLDSKRRNPCDFNESARATHR